MILQKSDAYQEALDKTAIVAITDLSGTITYVNDYFCRISKYSREELIGQNHNLVKSGQHPEEFFKDLWNTIKEGKVWTGQIKNKAKDSSYYWVQATIVPLLDDYQQPYQYLSFRLDITKQKLAEEQLMESIDRLSILTSNFPNGSVSLIDTGLTILFTGGAGYDTVDFGADEIIGKPLKEALSPQTYQFIEEQLPKILNGEIVTHEIFVRNRFFFNTYKPVYNKSGTIYGFVVVVQDITESKKAVLATQRKNDLFAIGEELAKIGSWECNVLTMEISFSSNALKLFGLDPTQVTMAFDEVIQVVHPEDKIRMQTQFQEMVNNTTADLIEYRIIHPNGDVRIVQSSGKIYEDENGMVIRIIGVTKDITERKESELELLESKELLKNIAESIPGLVMRYIEKANGKDEIQYVSKGAELLWEIPHEEIIQDENIVWKKIHPKDLRGFVKSFRKAKANISVWSYEYRIVMDDGRIKWISAIGTPKKMEDGSMMWNILALDVTDRKTAEEIIENNINMLTFQNTQLMDFCNIVSHNLRSPLVNMSMLVEFIEESEDESERKIFIEKLKPVIDNLNQTFEELVESIQIKHDHNIKSEKIDIEGSFYQVISGFEGQIAQSEALIEKDFSEAPIINYPHKYFSSILHNLISNSLKYRSPERRLKIKVKTSRKNHLILLTVEDNGLGIDVKKHKDNLFKIRKVFHRHPDAKGFGLFITKIQVEAMNGTIWVKSIPNEGSVFFVEFKNQ